MKLGSLFGVNRPGRRARAASRRPRLDRLEARQLLTTYVVRNTTTDLAGAITSANNNGGPDTITFDIPGTGVHVINASSLPTITEAVTIDGTTQPGYTDHPLIEISGTSGNNANGLRIAGSGTVIKGLAIDGFGQSGIRIETSNVTVEGSWIGFSPSTNQAKGNTGAGILVTGGSNFTIGGNGTGFQNVISGNLGAGIRLDGGTSTGRILGNFIGTDSSTVGPIANNVGIDIASANSITIGGNTPGDQNVISGNTTQGIQVIGTGNRNIQILGNVIGGDSTGSKSVANGGTGVLVQGAQNTRLGGPTSGDGNTIVSNGGNGVEVDQATGTVIYGNNIGTDSTGTLDLGNALDGILINSDNVVVGGSVAGQSNVIAFNGDGSVGSGGVVVASGVHNPILNNQIYQNSALGIDLGADGVTANDTGDNDTGANNLQNYPQLSQAATGAGRTLVQGLLRSQPSTTYLIQYFSVPQLTSGTVAQGQTLIGTDMVTTNTNGVATLNSLLSIPTKVGEYVTATATTVVTTGNGDTSEFAPGIQITKAQVADLKVDVTDSTDPANVNVQYSYLVTVTNRGPDPATNVQVTVNVPSVLSVNNATASQGSATLSGTGVTASLGTIASGSTATITVYVTPTLTGVYTVTASGFSSEIDTDTSNNAGSQSTTVTIPTDVALTLSQDPNPGVEGQPLTYVAILKNNGPGTADNVVVTAFLPDNTTYIGSAVGQGTVTRITDVENGVAVDKVVANLGSVANGGVVALRIQVSPSGVGTFTMHATSSADNEDSNKLGNNDQTLNAVVLPDSELSVAGSSSLAQPLGGDTVQYTYTIRNDGPANASNVDVTGKYDPAAFDLVSATTSDGQNLTDPGHSGTVSATLATLNASNTATLILTLKAKVGFVGTTKVTGVATTSDQVDLKPSNNTATVTTPINASELSVGLSAMPNPAVIGTNLAYTINVRNDGPANASNVVVTVNYPPDADFLSASGAPFVTDVGAAQFTLASVPAGQTVPLTLVIIPRNAGSLTTIARLTSFNALDVNATNNTATLTVPVSPADVAVSVSSSASSALVGDTIRYEAVVTNHGPVAADNVALVNTLPAGLQFVSATTTAGSVGHFGTDVSAQLGTLNPGDSAHVVFYVTAGATGSQPVTSKIGSTTYDSDTSNNQVTTGLQVTNAPGTIQFSQNLFVVQENAGSVQLTLNRTGGSQGAVSVHYALTPGNAQPGVNYTDESGTVTFNAGETSKTIEIPILVDGKTTGPLAFSVVLTNPTGGASVGPIGTATVGIANTDFDLVAPTVTNIAMAGSANSITSITLTFSEALNPATAGYAPNFAIVAPDGSRPAIYPPLYDAASNTVTIVPTSPLAGGRFYYVVVNSQGFAAVQDLSGNHLDGDANGIAGGDYVVSAAHGTQLTYGDADGDRVNLSLSRGGYLEMIRSLDGNAQLLRVIAPVPGQSVLSGTVRRQGFHGNGTTTIGQIQDGPFGVVRSRLTSPPFYVYSQLQPAVTALPVSAAVAVPRATAAHRFGSRRNG